MGSSISRKDERILCLRSGNKCAKCRRELTIKLEEGGDRYSVIGEMAHIKGEKSGAPRYDPNMTDKERNAYPNRILLCRNHHKLIDDHPSKYTVEKLHQMKREHEQWVNRDSEKLSLREIGNITFDELEAVTRYIISVRTTPSSSYETIPPKDKIRKNNLSVSAERLIKIGAAQVKLVENFINNHDDLHFGERLKWGFALEYERLRNEEGLIGDDLFNALHQFASSNRRDPRERTAALAVLVYLFNICEVFEE